MSRILSESKQATLLALIMAIGAVVTGVGPVGSVTANPNSGADIVVQEGESIQQAVNDASPGDVIAVEQGLYEESVRVNKSDITIKAKDPANPPTVRYQPSEPKENATFEVIESGVILSNLTIERVGHPDRDGDNETTAVAIVAIDSDRPDCRFTFSGCDDVTNDVTIKGNDIVGDFPLQNDSNGGVVVVDGTEYMFVVETDGDASNITIENNEIHNFSAGTGLVGEYGGTISDVEITGNDIYDNTAINDSEPEGTGVGFVRNTTDASFQNVRVTDNDITDNHYGVRLAGPEDDEDFEDVDASEITVNYNDVVNNSEWGAMNNGTNVLNATNNWWGDADGPSGEGPGNGDAVSTGVDYDPWLENSTA